MHSKNWKSWLALSLASTLLVACGGKGNGPSDASGTEAYKNSSYPYAGVWISEKTLQLYHDYRSSVDQGDTLHICKIVKRDQAKKRFAKSVYLIQAKGGLFRYNYKKMYDNQQTLEQYQIANVNGDGTLSGVDGRQSIHGHQLEASGDSLTWFREFGQTEFVRTNNHELEAIGNMIKDCTSSKVRRTKIKERRRVIDEELEEEGIEQPLPDEELSEEVPK